MEKINTEIPNTAIQLAKLFSEKGYEIFLVGGCVRDMIMGFVPHDYDFCSNARPEQMMCLCNEFNLKYIPTGLKHGTITICVENDQYEVTTYRIDGDYSDGRHPDTVTFTSDIEKDLARRDFTINAIAMHPISGRIVDPFFGREAIKTRVLTTPGDSACSIKDDALRILRALRFAIRYHLNIENHLAVAIYDYKDMLSVEAGLVSRERITDEFRKILTCDRYISRVFKLFHDVIAVCIPKIEDCFYFEQNNKYHAYDVYVHTLHVVDNCKTDKFEIKMAALLHDIGKPHCYPEDADGFGHFYGHAKVSADICRSLLKERFRLSNDEYSRIIELVEFHDMKIPQTTKSIKRMLSTHGLDFINDWLVLKEADIEDHINNADMKEKLQTMKILLADVLSEKQTLTVKDLAVNGNDLIQELHMKPGKAVGFILNSMLEKVLNEEVENTKEALLSLVK